MENGYENAELPINLITLRLSRTERLIFTMHMDGMSIPKIAKETGIDPEEVREAIVRVWKLDTARLKEMRNA